MVLPIIFGENVRNRFSYSIRTNGNSIGMLAPLLTVYRCYD